MHSKKIVHRDIKPSNIVISEDRLYVSLVDFGISCNIADPLSNKLLENI